MYLCLSFPRTGRPRITTAAQDAAIVNFVTNNPLTNAQKIRDELQLDLSRDAIRKRLAEHNIKHHRPAKKEHLTARHKAQRVAFARAYIDKDPDYWRRVVFNDEKSFCSTTHAPLHVYRVKRTRFE